MRRRNGWFDFHPEKLPGRIASLWLPVLIWVYLVAMLIASVGWWHAQYHPIYYAVAVLVAARFTGLRFVMAVAGAAIGLGVVTALVNHAPPVPGVMATLSLVVICGITIVIVWSRERETRELRQITVDLRQSLTVIMGDAQFIERYSTQLTDPQERAIGRIVGAVRRATALLAALDRLPSQRL